MEKIDYFIRNYGKDIEDRLTKHFDEIMERNTSSIYPNELLDEIKHYCLRGGKRLRPLLTVLTFKCFGGKKIKDIVDVAIANEIVHASMLIYDDIIDKDETRRGGKAFHKIFTCYGDKTSKNIALFTGPLLAYSALKIVLNSNFSEEKVIKWMHLTNGALQKTCYGQLLDVYKDITNEVLTETDVLSIYTLKTSLYSFQIPLLSGGIFSGCSPHEIKTLTKLSIPLGQLFQIKDDLLGSFGSQIVTGKPVDSDIKQGKKTILIVKALERANKSERLFIQRELGNENMSDKTLERIRQIIIKTKSIDYAQKKVTKLSLKVKRIVIESELKAKYKKRLLREFDSLLNTKSELTTQVNEQINY